MFLESEEDFTVDQTLHAGSLSPFPEPCGVGGEAVAHSWGCTSSLRIGGERKVQHPGPGPQRPKQTHMIESGFDNKEVAALITK